MIPIALKEYKHNLKDHEYQLNGQYKTDENEAMKVVSAIETLEMLENNLMYVCSPYRGDVKRNKEYARYLTRLAINNGFIPITVHLYLTEALDDNKQDERTKGMAAGLSILSRCKYILIGDAYGISEGMAGEIERAFDNGTIILREGEPGQLTPNVNVALLDKQIKEYKNQIQQGGNKE